MPYHVSTKSIVTALRHLCRYGDTDIFPHLRQIAFLSDEHDAVIAELEKLDLDNYAPAPGAIEALTPKGNWSFRIAHQLPALDTVLLLACVIEIGGKIEAKRQPDITRRAFSYRVAMEVESGQLFRGDRKYKDWLLYQQQLIASDKKIAWVLSTDISDYYSRINYHRLENLLDEVAAKHGAARFIKKHIKGIRVRQSFGLPVGGSAARVLAELAMLDIDQALRERDVIVTRFVDDFRIMGTKTENPYEVLGFLAEQLGINEGLSLNAAKTVVTPKEQYMQQLEGLTTDLSESAAGVSLETLTADLYFDDEPDEHDLETLKGLNIVEMLEKEIDSDNWDTGRIRVIFRALKIAKPKEATPLIEGRFAEMAIFAKELCLLMEALEKDAPGCFNDLVDDIVASILAPPASSVQLIRIWLLEVFVRGIIELPSSKIAKLEILPGLLDKQQLLLIRGRAGQKTYFRKQKTAVQSFSELELPMLVWGASCLPADEYKNWLDTLKGNFNKPLGGLFLKWLVKSQGELIDKLDPIAADPSD